VGFQADFPWAFLLLIPWLIYIVWISKMTIRLRGRRKIMSIATRSIILLLLIALVAQVQPFIMREHRSLIFVADRSESMRADQNIGEWVKEAWAAKEAADRGGIISSGLNAAVERTVTNMSLEDDQAFIFRANVNRNYTDLSQGLQLAAAMLQKEGGGRIVLLSDGAENSGDVRRQARMLKNAGISVDVVHINTSVVTDTSIEELSVPSSLKQGETFTFEIAISSTFSGSAQLRLYADDAELSVSNIQLERGENRFALQSVALDPGFHRFRAEIFAAGDEQLANNTAHAFSHVSGPPAVLIVEGVSGSSANMEAALHASAIRYETIIPEQLSVELAQYAAYDSIILNNVSATRIAEKPMEWIAKAVSDYGVGLMMIGGDNSFGLGGYFKTPIERALPVYMDLQGKKQIPSLGLVLVIDRSGSMMDGKLELAKEAAMRTIELLRDIDTVGVIAFDSAPSWVVEPTQLTDRKAVLAQIQGIQPAGGTEIFSALNEGYEGLSKLDAQRKHMILLTDGQSSTNANYKNITDAMNEKNITLSTVAVGEGADQLLLEQLAKNAKGRYYFTKDESTLPAIFSRETVMMSRTYIVEQIFTPTAGQAGDWSSLWRNGLPAIHAYIATTPKETAETALWTSEGDPLLARWPYGSGRTVAWTSDLTGKWSSHWVQWAELPNVFVEWVKWTFLQFDQAPYTISTQMDGNEAKLTVHSQTEGAGADNKLTAGIQDQAGNNELKRLMPVAPGQFETKLTVYEPGVYLAQIGQGDNQASIQNGSTTGFVIPYSPEYRMANEDGLALLEQVAAATDGRVIDPSDPKQAFQFEPVSTRHAYNWTRDLLVIALLLWLLDIAIRRLSFSWERGFQLLFQPFRRRVKLAFHPNKERASSELSTSSLTRLKERKSEASRFYAGDGHIRNRGSELNMSQSIAGDTGTQAPAREVEQVRNDDLNGSSYLKRNNVNQQAEAESGATINRLLAAKNRNKR
jgi:Ca-activated chloride channel family protein